MGLCALVPDCEWDRRKQAAGDGAAPVVLPSAAGGGRGRVRVPYYDLVLLADIRGPVFLQPDETADMSVED